MDVRKKLIDDKERIGECRNCIYGTPDKSGEKIFCEKTGVRLPESTCKKFRYDPLKRIPGRTPQPMKFSQEDFEL